MFSMYGVQKLTPPTLLPSKLLEQVTRRLLDAAAWFPIIVNGPVPHCQWTRTRTNPQTSGVVATRGRVDTLFFEQSFDAFTRASQTCTLTHV